MSLLRHQSQTDGVTVTSLSARFQHMTSVAMDCMDWLCWWHNHTADIVSPSTALAFVTKMCDKCEFTSPSAIQMINLSLSLSLSNGATAQGGPRPPLEVSSILPGLGRLLSNFYILASLYLPNAVWVEHSRSLNKIRSFSRGFFSVSRLVLVLPAVLFSLH